MNRRTFLAATTAITVRILMGSDHSVAGDGRSGRMLRFGIVADAHYADRPSKNGRSYRQSLAKMATFIEEMNEGRVDFIIELGDLKDQSEQPDERSTLDYLETIEQVFGHFRGSRYHVLGNHDLDSISKSQFLERVENSGIEPSATYYSFDVNGFHFVVLDANYHVDGSDFEFGNFDWRQAHVPQVQREWLQHDLAASNKPTIIFTHQQLDGPASHCIGNGAEVRRIIEDSGKVLAVFQGHYHPGYHGSINDIHYYTLRAMVDGSGQKNNSYGIVEVFADNRIAVSGRHRAVDLHVDGRPIKDGEN
jgi:hypothetical protein